jgi:CzcA family heavy metal efflux pump
VIARVVAGALAQRVVVLVLAACVALVGADAARRAPLDVFPEFTPPIVEVQAEAPGLDTEDVEALVVVPIERALGGTPGLDALRSSAAPGLAVVTAVFPYGADPLVARQLVTERVALAAAELPPTVRSAVAPLASALGMVLAIGLRGDAATSPLVLRDLAEWTIRPRLLAVPGVANVVVYGGAVRQLQVTTSSARLWAAGVTLDDVVASVAAANAAAGSGFVDRSGQRLPAWLDGRIHDVESVARAPLVGREAVPLPVGAVADVGEGPALPVGDALVNGEPGVLVLVMKQPGVNVVAITREVEAAVEALYRAFPPGVRVDRAMFRQAAFVEHAIANLWRALLAGGVLVTIVLLLFLGDVRTALVSVVAIPLSLLGAVAVLRAMGASLDVMVLGGLAIAVGEVVDDAIIDVENAWRRLRAAPPGTPVADVVLAASVEVRSAVAYATVMVALVFLPVFLLGGLAGALFRPLATAYVFATLCSLVVALTVTPALVVLLLPAAVGRHPAPPRLVQSLRARYERALGRVLRRPHPLLAGSAAVVIAGVALATLLHLEFLPEFQETNFIMHMTGAPGIGLDESSRVGAAVGRTLLEVAGVRSVAQFIGRATLFEDTWGAERSELLVQLDPDAHASETTAAILARVAGIAGFAFDLKQYVNERIEELLGGTGGAILVRLRGTDLPALRGAGAAVAARLAAVPGAADVHAPTASTSPGIRIRPRRDDLLRLDVPAAAVERTLRAALDGIRVARVVRDGRQADVVVRLPPDARHDPAELQGLAIARRGRRMIPLGAVADVETVPLAAAITHEDGGRSAVVRLDARGRSLEAVAVDVARTVDTMPLPAGVYAEVAGQYAAAREARTRLLRLGALALAGIFLLLLVDFRSPRLAALTMVNVPLAFVGGVAAVLIGAGGALSLGAIVGFVTVFGITLRNGIVLLAQFRHVEAERGAPLTADGIAVAAADRLAPILMTALTTGIALVPLLALGGRAGGEIEHPMALVIVGGLVTSTWLNLFVVPAWYARTATRA